MEEKEGLDTKSSGTKAARGKKGTSYSIQEMKKRKIRQRSVYSREKRLERFLEEKRKKWRKEEEEELRNLKNPEEVWRYINRMRGKKEWRENNISNDEWERHFVGLLDGRRYNKGKEVNELEDREKIKEAESEILVTGAEEVALEELEIWQALRRTKDNKNCWHEWHSHESMEIQRNSDKEWFQRIIEPSMKIQKLFRRMENRGNCVNIQERRPRQDRKL